MWQEFGKLLVRMRIDPAQNIFEVFKRIDFISFTGGDQAHKNGRSFTAALATDKKKVLFR